MCYVYIIHEEDSPYYKIGISSNPNRRLMELAIGNPHDLVLRHVVEVEDRDTALYVEKKILDNSQIMSPRPNCEWMILDHMDYDRLIKSIGILKNHHDFQK